MARVAKVHRSLRIDADTDAAVSQLRTSEETMTDAINRVLRVGVETLQADREEKPQEPEHDELVEALKAHIETLGEQLKVKDIQIEGLNSSLQAAHTGLLASQQLHAAEMQPIAIEAHTGAQTAQDATQGEYTPQDIPSGFWARLRWAFSH